MCGIPPNLIQTDYHPQNTDRKAHCVCEPVPNSPLKASPVFGKCQQAAAFQTELVGLTPLVDVALSRMWTDVLWICDVVPPLYKYLVQMELCCWDGRSSQPVISQGRTQYDSISTAGKWSMPWSARHRALIWPCKTFSPHIMLIKD